MGKAFKYVIIFIAEENKPVAWSENDKQLCRCTEWNWPDEPHPIRFYTIAKATRLIEKTRIHRLKWRLSPIMFITMPFDLTYWQESISKKLKK